MSQKSCHMVSQKSCPLRLLWEPFSLRRKTGRSFLVTEPRHAVVMLFTIKTKFGRHTRESIFDADCVECAPEIALSHAKAFERGQGVYGPQAWKFGRITIWSLMTEPVVIREQRPQLTLVSAT